MQMPDTFPADTTSTSADTVLCAQGELQSGTQRESVTNIVTAPMSAGDRPDPRLRESLVPSRELGLV